jgi:hypothetical protein
MKTLANIRSWVGALLVVGCFALTFTAAALAEEKMTAKTLIDRQQILDLITRYYYNFGKENPESFADFYADDAVLILGTRRYEGKAGIMQAYGRSGGAPAGAARATAAPPAPRPKRYSFNVTISNPLIVVHGNTATSQIIFTEYVQEKQGDPTKMTTQGKEYGTFVRVNGQWRYKTRQISGGSEPPADWKE